MDNDAFPDDLRYGKRIDQECLPCVAVTAYNRRQIAAVIGVWGVVGIIMASCLIKIGFCILRTISVFVYMESEKMTAVVSADHGKSVKLCIDKNTAGHLAEEDTAAQIGIQTASVNGGDGIGNDGI